jgi:hypothetical protein
MLEKLISLIKNKNIKDIKIKLMQQPDKKNNLKIQYVHHINDKRT